MRRRICAYLSFGSKIGAVKLAVDGGDSDTLDNAFGVASHGGRILVAGLAAAPEGGARFAAARLTNY